MGFAHLRQVVMCSGLVRLRIPLYLAHALYVREEKKPSHFLARLFPWKRPSNYLLKEIGTWSSTLN